MTSNDITMLDFYTWKTPNGRKVAILLEELQLPYRLLPIDISKQAQFTPEFLRLNPNNKIPVIVDHDTVDQKPFILAESGAILIYLAEKNQQFIPSKAKERALVIQWLMFQMSSLGPMLGQLGHFLYAAPEKIPYAIERYSVEATRIYNVLNQQLANHDYLAGDYSIADMACFPWIASHERHQINLQDYPQVDAWFQRIAKRPAVIKGMAIPS